MTLTDTAILQGQTYTLPGGNTVTTAGTYTDTLQNTAGCDSVITTELSVISALTSLSIQHAQLSIYPNPANGSFTVSVSENLTGQTLTITDVIGKLVFQSKISNLKSEINVSHWGAGVYLVKVGSTVKRLVVQ